MFSDKLESLKRQILMITSKDILNAQQRIAPYIRKTPLEFSHFLKKESDINIFLKLENHQVSGSFKPRGAFNKILTNPDAEFVAPTAGGHGVGLSHAAHELNVKAHILMPKSADSDRIRDIEANGAAIHFFDSVPEARIKAKEIEKEKGYVFVSAFNDREMIEGGGTIAVEIIEQLANIDCLVCGVGGGGYLAGMAIFLKSINPSIKLYGVQQENAPFLAEWFHSKSYPENYTSQPSIAEGVGAEVEKDCITWPYIEKYVDDFLLVSEAEIKENVLWMLKNHKQYVEPSAVVGLAAIRANPKLFTPYQAICTVITGQNMSFSKFESLLKP